VKQVYERDRLVGWTTSERVVEAHEIPYLEYMHELILVMSVREEGIFAN